MSTGDLIGLIALLLGVVLGVLTVLAAVLVPIALRQRRDRREVRLVEQQAARLGLMSEMVASVVGESSSYCRFVAGLADAALSSSGGNEWADLGEVLRKYEETLQRKILELQAFSDDEARRHDALTNLAGGLGDISTLAVLERLRSGFDDPAVEVALEGIRARLYTSEVD